MNPQHPRTSDGPRYPDSLCSGTAEQLFGLSEEEVARMADEDTDDSPYGDVTTHTCARCSRPLPVADDQSDPGPDDLALDSRGLVAANEYVCGACLEAAEDALQAK